MCCIKYLDFYSKKTTIISKLVTTAVVVLQSAGDQTNAQYNNQGCSTMKY